MIAHLICDGVERSVRDIDDRQCQPKGNPMAEHLVDAAIRLMDGGRDVAYFFINDQFVVWDWVDDRCRNGVHALDELAAPPGFVPPQAIAPAVPTAVIDAALTGKHGYAGFHYLFSGGHYVRFRTAPARVFDPVAISDLASWRLPFARVDASYNGALNRDDFCYFFRGSQYVRYSWSRDLPDGPSKQIANMVAMPPTFATGVDAGVDGGAGYEDCSYLFKETSYVRFQWVNGAVEPHAEAPSPILGNWVGLAELLAVAKAKSIAVTWLAAAQRQLAAYVSTLTLGTPFPFDQAVIDLALDRHFHILPGQPPAAKAVLVGQILGVYALISGTLAASATKIWFRTEEEANVQDVGSAVHAAYVWPLAPSPDARINITRHFLDRSELNRVSSLIHEAMHVNDPASATSDNHISEWYVTAPMAATLGLAFQPDAPATFATRYDLMDTAHALHNPSAYATFARHVSFGVDNRELP
ncbi:MAG: hypothetical protein NW204_09465 [Xanthomonadaceae bacterium]|nr:hypothetical protein [Xanthomonadaceae bacterium]